MKNPLLILLMSLLAHAVYPQSRVPVFESGSEGHKSYRIPAIIGLADGTMLAFAEGRVHSSGDFGDVNVVMKRSKDRGKTWSSLQTLVDYDSLQAGNPAPVADLADPLFPQGRIFLFYNTGNNHENEVRKGKGLREVWYVTSANGGDSWSEPVNITTQVHRPKQPHIDPRYNFPDDWRSYANTPGHAVQFTSGKYAGRIFVPANHSAGEPQPEFRDYAAHGYYTDDHGKTFHLGKSLSVPGSNESTATDLADGTLMMNVRNQRGDIRLRIVALSRSGGEQWDSTYFDPQLPDPVCEGTILAIGKKKRKTILAFCNAADSVHRDNLMLRISFDGGKTWKKNIVVDKSPPGEEGDHAAYSDIVKVARKKIGVLYERDGYTSIVFSAISW